jgi:hypothetical protein
MPLHLFEALAGTRQLDALALIAASINHSRHNLLPEGSGQLENSPKCSMTGTISSHALTALSNRTIKALYVVLIFREDSTQRDCGHTRFRAADSSGGNAAVLPNCGYRAAQRPDHRREGVCDIRNQIFLYHGARCQFLDQAGNFGNANDPAARDIAYVNPAAVNE